MRIIKRVQISNRERPKISHKDEKLILQLGKNKGIYDFSDAKEGEYSCNIEPMEGQYYILGAGRKDGEIFVELYWPIGKKADREECLPLIEKIAETKKMPKAKNYKIFWREEEKGKE